MDIRKALDYVRAHGSALERARAETLVAWMPPAPEAVALLERAQRADGGWPLGLAEGRPSSVGGTCEVLFALHDFGLHEQLLAQRGLQYILAQQGAGGEWQDWPAPATAQPRWLTRGEEACRLYLTAWASSVLVAYGRADGAAAHRAIDVMLKFQQEDGLFPGFPFHTAWYGLPLLAHSLGMRSGPAQNILLALGRELAAPEWFPSMFAAMLYNLLLAGYSMETPLVRAAWEQLLMRQGDDGVWASEDGEAGAVRSTIEVMRCWHRIVKK